VVANREQSEVQALRGQRAATAWAAGCGSADRSRMISSNLAMLRAKKSPGDGGGGVSQTVLVSGEGEWSEVYHTLDLGRE
jgi:hypothetical protein